VAALAYRTGKTLRGAPEGFSDFRISEATRSAGEILAHIGELLDWALCLAKGRHEWHDSAALPWDQASARFIADIESLDGYLASENPLECPAERVFQGPIADALTHTGQIAMLRRLAGAPVRGENYFKAEIVAGRTGREQPPPLKEFD